MDKVLPYFVSPTDGLHDVASFSGWKFYHCSALGKIALELLELSFIV